MTTDGNIVPFRRLPARTGLPRGGRTGSPGAGRTAAGDQGNPGSGDRLALAFSALAAVAVFVLAFSPWGMSALAVLTGGAPCGNGEHLLTDRSSLAEGPNGGLVRVTPYVAEQDCVRVATSARQQQQGLKEQLNPQILAFSWRHPTRPSLTMQDVPSNLTLVWVADGRVVASEPMESETTTVHTAPVPVTLAVEYPAPLAGESGPAVGDQLSLG